MRVSHLVGVAAATLLSMPNAAGAAEVLKTENASLDIGGRLQLLGFAQRLEDAHRDDTRMYLFLKQGRLRLFGNYGELKFVTQMALGGESEVKAPSPGVALDLLDFFADVPLPIGGKTYIRVGQFKVPYGRERLTDGGSLLFADRSIQNMGFRVGRDVGVALHTQAGPLVAGAGVFTGGGRDIPERYLPQTLGVPMFTFRAGVDHGIGENIFVEPWTLPPADRFQAAFFVNGLYSKDSLVGHSSVFNTKITEKPLLTNGNWNPYIGKAPLEVGKLWQVGADAIARAPVGPGTLSGELELNFGVYQNALGDIRMPGGRVQVAYAWQQLEIAMRYALLLPDENFKFGESQITGTRSIQEVTPALTYHFKKYGAKIIADLPIHLGAPVIMEDKVGAYVLTQMPDQASMLKNNAPITRQDVVEARLLFQAAF